MSVEMGAGCICRALILSRPMVLTGSRAAPHSLD
jgi:hypothetical protein